jgi:hypothetical protein
MLFGLVFGTFLLLVLWTDKARSSDCVWREQQYACVGTITGHRSTCTRWRCVHPRSHYYRERGRHHYRHPGREFELRRRAETQNCMDFTVRVTGDDRLSQERAKVSAQDRWAVTVGTRYGAIFSDIDHAEDQDMTCVKQAPSSNTEKTQADMLGIRHHICELVARPCSPEPVEQDAQTRAKRRFER